MAYYSVSKNVFASEVIMSCHSNWIMLLLLCTSAPLVLCCDRFDLGSRQVKCDLEDLVRGLWQKHYSGK